MSLMAFKAITNVWLSSSILKLEVILQVYKSEKKNLICHYYEYLSFFLKKGIFNKLTMLHIYRQFGVPAAPPHHVSPLHLPSSLKD